MNEITKQAIMLIRNRKTGPSAKRDARETKEERKIREEDSYSFLLVSLVLHSARVALATRLTEFPSH